MTHAELSNVLARLNFHHDREYILSFSGEEGYYWLGEKGTRFPVYMGTAQEISDWVTARQ